jgi:hypothetical protein
MAINEEGRIIETASGEDYTALEIRARQQMRVRVWADRD